jgi:Xaa-Pro aminopeptidase
LSSVSPDQDGRLFAARLGRVHEMMGLAGMDVLLLSMGADLPWLTGYVAMPLERLTMLVVPSGASGEQPTLVVPELEAPRVKPVPQVFGVRPWRESEDPVGLVEQLVKRCSPGAGELRVAISDRAWASSVLALQASLPRAGWVPASVVTAPLRAIKDAFEVEALARASAAADRVAAALLAGEIRLIGRSERDVSAEISRRLTEEGHEKVNFAIVAAGPNAASPHHEATGRPIGRAEPVVCDFGGSLDGYCSDITRTVFTGTPPRELAKIYDAVAKAQAAGVLAAEVGALCCDVDLAARRVITDAGLGERFIHRTGHGIGLEEHEEPYMVAGNTTPVTAGHAFSVEPGVYVPGRWGVRIEDIVVATPDGPRSLNQVDRSLTVVEA